MRIVVRTLRHRNIEHPVAADTTERDSHAQRRRRRSIRRDAENLESDRAAFGAARIGCAGVGSRSGELRWIDLRHTLREVTHEDVRRLAGQTGVRLRLGGRIDDDRQRRLVGRHDPAMQREVVIPPLGRDAARARCVGDCGKIGARDRRSGNNRTRVALRAIAQRIERLDLVVSQVGIVEQPAGADEHPAVGTGRLLDDSDLTDDQIQTFYALRDGTQSNPSAIVAGSPITRADLAPVTDATGTGGITAKGWYNDLALHSRIVSPYQAALSIVVYSATKPQTDPCLTGQSADIFVRDFSQGVSQIDPSQFTGTGTDTCTANSCSSEGGAVDAQIIGVTPDGSTSPNLAVEITLGSSGKTMKIPIKQPAYDYSHRLSWRILSE